MESVFGFFLGPLLLTWGLEAAVIWFGMGILVPKGRRGKFISNFVLINAITNLSLNFLKLLMSLFLGTYIVWGIVIVLELMIPVIEAKMYRYTTSAFSLKRAIVTCYIANLFSFFVGSGSLYFWG